jgi:DNA-binding NarL/FixJ family response regulator
MKVLVIDDHPLILHAIRSLVQQLAERVDVVTATTPQAARDALSAGVEFDLALLDLHLGDEDGFAVLEELRPAYPSLPIVVVAASDCRDDVMRAIDMGAMGFVPKCTSNETLVSALEMVLSGGIYLPASVMRSHSSSRSAAERSGSSHFDERFESERAAATVASLDLTPRQKEVLALLLRGQSNKLIARALNLSVETIKDHVAAVLRALNVSSRTQAVVAVSQMSRPGSAPAWRQPQRAALRS